MTVHGTNTRSLVTITSVVQLPFLTFPASFATIYIPLDTQKSRENVANCLTPSPAIHHHGFTTTASPLTRGAKQLSQNEEEGGKREGVTKDKTGY
jgi:hypothetical protein